MAILGGKNCPLCGVYLKPENRRRHFDHVHPEYSEESPRIVSVLGMCPICGTRNDSSKNRYNLSICDTHYVKDVRSFLIKSSYIKLKQKNNAELVAEQDAAFWMMHLQLQAINALLGWSREY